MNDISLFHTIIEFNFTIICYSHRTIKADESHENNSPLTGISLLCKAMNSYLFLYERNLFSPHLILPYVNLHRDLISKFFFLVIQKIAAKRIYKNLRDQFKKALDLLHDQLNEICGGAHGSFWKHSNINFIEKASDVPTHSSRRRVSCLKGLMYHNFIHC